MWIESHQSLRKHPKVVRAARALSISRVTLIGHLHCLWWWALDYAQDGNLSAFAPEDIAEAAEWEGVPQDFIRALLEAARIGDKPGLLEYLDGALCIHDWWDYAGKLIDKRKADAERKRVDRRKDGAPVPPALPADVPQTSNGRPTDVAGTVPTVPTVPNPTEPTEPTAAASAAWQAFTKARGVNLSRADSEYIAELEQLYGDTETAQAIVYCDIHKNRNFLTLSYIQSVLTGWQADGTLGLHGTNGNGSTPKPTGKATIRVDYGDGQVVDQEIKTHG